MKLLKLTSEIEVEPNPHIVHLKPIKRIIDNADDPIKELSYIYHMCDPESPYFQISSNIREEKVREDLFNEDWEKPERVNEAIDWYKEQIKDPILDLLESVQDSIYKLKQYFDAYDPTEVDQNGKLVWNTKDVIMNMNRLSDVANNVEELRERIKKKEEQSGDIRSGVELNKFNR